MQAPGDIPDRDPAAADLSAEDRIARAAFVAMPIAAFLLDDEARIVLHTRRAGRLYHDMTGQPGSGLTGVDFAHLTHLDTGGLFRALRVSISSGLITLPMKDAHRVKVPKDVTFHLSLMRIEGVRRQLYMLSQDHLRASATALQNANQMREKETSRGQHLEAHISTLQSSVMSMETFAHAASHDLKSPINALGSLLNLFCSKYAADLPSDAQPYLEHMQSAVVQMDALTTKLMTHAKSAAAPLKMRRVRVQDAIQTALAGLDPDALAQAQDITVDGPAIDVMAEPTMLQVLMVNLLSNALKHGRADHPLDITLMTEAAGEGAMLTVTDTGTGFAPDQAQAIFAPFLRLKPDVQGSGVGLATCTEICRRHNWGISARSDGETGATFTIRFPRVLVV